MVTNSERRMTRQRAFLAAPGEAKPDWQAIAEVGSKLCRKLDVADGFDYHNEVSIFTEYAKMTGINRQSNLQLDLSSYAQLSEQGYQDWQPVQWGGERPFANGSFSHSDGKARFVITHSEQGTASRAGTEPKGWWLNTGRQRDQWHTMTRTGHVSHLAASEVEPTVYMNMKSAQALKVEPHQLVAISQVEGKGRIYAKAAVDDRLTDRQLYMSMHWAGPYGRESQVNAVVSRVVDPHSGQPAFKSSSVAIEPAGAMTYGVYIGRQYDAKPGERPYLSYQAEQGAGVWRFADLEVFDRADVIRYKWQPHTRRIVMDIDAGMVAVDFTEVGGQKYTAAILIVSRCPIEADYQKLVTTIGQPVSVVRLLDIIASHEASSLVCSCFRVSDRQIIRALEQGECHSLEQLKACLKCGTNCGSCTAQVEQLVTAHRRAIPVSFK
jgi:assimilatory nitrate reductase catalytic subunit